MSLVLEIVPFIDTNTGQYIDDMTLQATIANLLIIHPRDKYGNIIHDRDDLVFMAVLDDSDNLITSKFTIINRFF